jgi:hypothetical protein
MRQLKVRAAADPDREPLLIDVQALLARRHQLAHSIAYVVGKQDDEDFVVFCQSQHGD